MRLRASAVILCLALPGVARAANPLRIVEVRVDRPTHHALGIQVLTSDDDDRDARVDVRVRKKGDATWRAATPLFRVLPETVSTTPPPQMAGSVFDLSPGTAYE